MTQEMCDAEMMNNLNEMWMGYNEYAVSHGGKAISFQQWMIHQVRIMTERCQITVAEANGVLKDYGWKMCEIEGRLYMVPDANYEPPKRRFSKKLKKAVAT